MCVMNPAIWIFAKLDASSQADTMHTDYTKSNDNQKREKHLSSSPFNFELYMAVRPAAEREESGEPERIKARNNAH